MEDNIYKSKTFRRITVLRIIWYCFNCYFNISVYYKQKFNTINKCLHKIYLVNLAPAILELKGRKRIHVYFEKVSFIMVAICPIQGFFSI